MIKGVIFDMDGVVIDSNHIHYEYWNSVFESECQITIPKDDFARQLGRNPKDFVGYFKKVYDVDDRIIKKIEEKYKGFKHRIVLKPGFKTIIKELHGKYKIALATGAARVNAIEHLERLGIMDYFDFIIGGDEVHEAKPHPEIFQKAASGLYLPPQDCVVIEDAELGIMAAIDAGIKVIAVYDDLTKDQDHSIADVKIESIHELIDTIKNIGG